MPGQVRAPRDWHGIRLLTTLAAASATGDPNLAESLVANLVDNAIRHNMPGGQAEITTALTAGGAVITVSNTGTLIPPGIVEDLFQPFRQLGTQRIRHGDGHGLGLATAGLLRAAGVTVTGVDIDELDTALTTGPRPGRGNTQATARIGFTAAGTGEPRQMTVRIGYALAMAAATGAPVRVADQLMDQLAVPAQGDLVGQFTREVPLPKRRRGLSRLFRRHPPVRLAAR